MRISSFTRCPECLKIDQNKFILYILTKNIALETAVFPCNRLVRAHPEYRRGWTGIRRQSASVFGYASGYGYSDHIWGEHRRMECISSSLWSQYQLWHSLSSHCNWTYIPAGFLYRHVPVNMTTNFILTLGVLGRLQLILNSKNRKNVN